MVRKLTVLAAMLLVVGSAQGKLGRSQGEIALQGFKQSKAFKHADKIDKCIYNMNTKRVICYRGSEEVKIFHNVSEKPSSTTGTPGHFQANFLGYYDTEAPTPGLSGSGKKMNVFAE